MDERAVSTPKIPPPCWEIFSAQFVSMEPGHVVIRFEPTEEHTNPYGLVQGGLLAAMIDNCIGPAVFMLVPDRQTTTVELRVSYLSPLHPGEVALGDAQVIRHGRTTAYVEVSLTRESDGMLLARASATNVFLGRVDAGPGALTA